MGAHNCLPNDIRNDSRNSASIEVFKRSARLEIISRRKQKIYQ